MNHVHQDLIKGLPVHVRPVWCAGPMSEEIALLPDIFEKVPMHFFQWKLIHLSQILMDVDKFEDEAGTCAVSRVSLVDRSHFLFHDEC